MSTLPRLNVDFQITPHAIVVTTAWGLVLGLDPARYCAVFSATVGNNLYLSYGAPNSGTFGIVLGNSGVPFVVNFRDHPGLPAGPWYAVAITGTVNLYVVESVYWPQE